METSNTASSPLSGEEKGRRSGLSRYYLMPVPVKIIFLMAPVVAIILFIIHWFSIPVFGKVLAGTSYYYLIFAVLGFNVFMGLGATRKQREQSPRWYDYALSVTLWITTVYFLINSNEIAYRNWDSPPNSLVFVSALIFGGLGIEAGRRVGGWGYSILLLVSIIYPVYASHPWLANNLGGVFYGVSFPFREVVSSFAFGADGILGIPARMMGEMILGFFLFAGLTMGMGGGAFFIKLSTALLGRVRGGQAKAAVLASGFFGSITGSAIANVAGTGSFTIPAIKKTGYSPEYAGAIEACASTGSDTMPPVLGGLAFMMVVIFGVDYADIVVAAFLPSALYYLGLLVQVDGYAARHGIKPVPSGEIPGLLKVLLEGWVYLVGLGLLVFGLVYMRWGAITPVYAAGAVLVLQVVHSVAKRIAARSQEQISFRESLHQAAKRVEGGLVQTSGLVNYSVAIFIGIGFIMVGLLKTGVAAGLAGWIMSMGGSNLYLVLFVCSLFCIAMGMIGLERTAYLFLAVIAVPAVLAMSKTVPEFAVYSGIPIIGLNLFLIFYSSLGGITPPVALTAYVAAHLAGANPLRTALLAWRLGAVLLFLPFFLVLNPALLIIYTPWWQTVLHLLQAILGIWLLASGLSGYLVFFGTLNKYQRILLVAGGFLFAFPHPVVLLGGFAICISTIGFSLISLRNSKIVGEVKPTPYLETIDE